jgi:alpha-glucosidase
MPSIKICALFLLTCGWSAFGKSGLIELRSPNRRIHVLIEMPSAGSNDKPRWSAAFQDKSLFQNCGLGLEIESGELMSGARVVRESRSSTNEKVRVLFGKRAETRDRYREVRLELENASGRKSEVTFRCYDDAVALRYQVQGEENETTRVKEERTSFEVQGEPMAYAQYLENYKTSHEHEVNAVAYPALKKETLIDLPLTFLWKDGVYAAVTEASLRNYAGMALKKSSTNDSLVASLTPREDGFKVIRKGSLKTPWRVVLIGDRPGALLESTTIYCLNEPSAIKDTTWIKPGKITFHWWNSDVIDGRKGPSPLSFEFSKTYIDFCASNGIPTHSISSTEDPTSPWYQQSKRSVEPGPDTDVTKPRAGFDLDRINAYAKQKNVKLWTWVHQGALRGRVDEAFAAFEKMGWTGMMVDFFDHDDQATVEFAEQVVKAAAKHHQLVQLHGIWKPTGWERTYPNLVNHEGALNLEYLKWSNRCTPEHTLNLAFTRAIAGPMDYHLGGFRAVPRAKFKPLHTAPNVLGTRCHMLAMYVCFDNSNPMLADYPTAYESQPGFDFLKIVPTWWDETRVLIGEVGKTLVTARRKGRIWYLGGLSAGPARDVNVPLEFLGKGKFAATIWKDAANSDLDPNNLVRESSEVRAKDGLNVRLAADGGFVAKIEKR